MLIVDNTIIINWFPNCHFQHANNYFDSNIIDTYGKFNFQYSYRQHMYKFLQFVYHGETAQNADSYYYYFV